jgi:hypothetical protein
VIRLYKSYISSSSSYPILARPGYKGTQFLTSGFLCFTLEKAKRVYCGNVASPRGKNTVRLTGTREPFVYISLPVGEKVEERKHTGVHPPDACGRFSLDYGSRLPFIVHTRDVTTSAGVSIPFLGLCLCAHIGFHGVCEAARSEKAPSQCIIQSDLGEIQSGERTATTTRGQDFS